MAEAMAKTTKTMATVNQQVSLPQVQKTMMNFEKETAKMDMAGELMDDTLDSILAGSDEEEESEAIIGQVLDEIGIDLNSKLAHAPKTKLGGEETVGTETADLERQLRELQTS
jgi:charged multivesicular body protein 2B